TAICTNASTRAVLATLTREPHLGLFVLHTLRTQVAAFGQVILPRQVSHGSLSRSLACLRCRALLASIRAAPHSSSLRPATAPFQTLHLDVWGPAPCLGPERERYFLVVVEKESRYPMLFPRKEVRGDFYADPVAPGH
ncbi:unnamed protein product, partial [Closterium sp. NIES-53]